MEFQNAIAFRRDLHNLAELSGNEIKTSEYIYKKLTDLGLKPLKNVGGHGIVVDIDSGKAGPVIMFRADIDALPYPDENEPEKMVAIHACGHDAHAGMLLAAVPTLKAVVSRGKLRLIFQPAEESLEGALAMIRDGVLDGVDIAVGAHIRPIQDLAFGQFCAAVNHVACATVEVTIRGKVAHAARPHLGVNPIEAATQLIGAVALIRLNPAKSWSIKPTQIHSEAGATNSIPSFVKVTFDIRAQDNQLLDSMLSKLSNIAQSLQSSCEAQTEIKTLDFCPGPDYDPQLVSLLENTIKEAFGQDSLAPNCGGGGEDFHFYKKEKPELRTAYFGVGVGATPGLHNRNMTFDDSILPSGSKLFVEIAKKLLG